LVVVNIPFLLLSGPPGVGKTTVSWEIFDQLVQEGHCPALVDIDLLGASWPVPADDPYNERLKARNMRAMWSNFYAAGARCLISAGVVESRAQLAPYQSAIPEAVIILCRLQAGADVLGARIAARGRERGAGIEKLKERANYLSAQLARTDGADIVIDTDNRSIPEVARLIRTSAGGWPHPIT